MEKAIYAADPVTGFIVAAVLIRKGTKLKDLTVDFLKNRFKEKVLQEAQAVKKCCAAKILDCPLTSFLLYR